MKTPSLKNLTDAFKIAPEVAKLIKKLGKAHSESADAVRAIVESDERLKKTAEYARSCNSSPWNNRGWTTTMVLHAINDLVGGYGVEALAPEGSFSAWPPFEYVNMGDTYATTLIYSRRNHADNLFIGSWGGVVEAMKW